MRTPGKVLAWVVLLGTLAGAAERVAAVPELRRSVLSSGGVAEAIVGTITLRSTISQTAVVHSTVGPYELRSGFWSGVRTVGTGVEALVETPAVFELAQNWPNPFRHATAIRFGVPAGGGTVRLRVFDVTGRRVRTLVDGETGPGWQTVTWDGRDEGGTHVAAGIYFCVLETPTGRHDMRMTALR
jgi:hypothetical protein